MNARLIHDVAFSTATVLLETVSECLPAEVIKDVHDEFYFAVKAGIAAYEMHREKMEQRLNPLTPNMN